MTITTSPPALAVALCAILAAGANLSAVGRLGEGLPSMLDVAVEIVSPDTYEAPGLVPVQVRLTNMGDTSARVPRITVKFVPSVYRDSLQYVTVDVGESKMVTLNPWVAPVGDSETCTAWITYPADSSHANDTDVVFVRTASGPDVATEIVSPTDNEEPGLVPVQIRLTNMFVYSALVPRLDVKVRSGYADSSLNIAVLPGVDTVVTLNPWIFGGGTETCTAYTNYPADSSHWNDTDVVIVNVGGVSGSVGTEPYAGMNLVLLPSPLVGNVLQVEYSLNRTGPASVVLFDSQGRVAIKRYFTGSRRGELPLNLSGLSGGVYLLRLDDGRSAITGKLVVQR